MGRKKIDMKQVVVVVMLSAIIGASAFAGWYYIAGPGSSQSIDDGNISTFSIQARNGITGKVIKSQYVDFTLYGVEAGDLDSFSRYEVVKTGADLDLITAALLAASTEYAYFVLCANATEPATVYDDTNEEYAHVYYPRWSLVSPGVVNTVFLYEEFSDTGVAVLLSETGSPITAAYGSDGLNLTTAANLTFIVTGNQSQFNAAWVEGYNYETQELDSLDLVLNFNATVEKADFNMNGASEAREGTTGLKYKLPTLYHTPLFLNSFWDVDAEDLEIDEILLYHNGNLLFNSSA